MKFDDKGRIQVERRNPTFPNLIDQGKKFGLSEVQIKQLSRYLDDKRLLRLINLENFNRNARAWLSALTGIIADVLAIDAHVSIWMDKKLEKPRNWIIQQLSNVIPTKIDDMAFKAIQTAQSIMDNKILPLKEDIMTRISSNMHKKYDYNNNYTYLGNSLKDLKSIAKDNLKDSSAVAKSDAIKILNQRKFQSATLGGYYDSDGDFVSTRKYKNQVNKIFRKEKITDNENNEEGKEQSKRTSSKSQGEVP